MHLTLKDAGFVLLIILALVMKADHVPCSEEERFHEPVFHASLDVAYESALSDGSLVLIIFTAKWCIFCEALDKLTLESEDFLQSPAGVHIIVVDVDVQEELAREYNINFLPYLVLLSPDGKIIDQTMGVLRPEKMLLWIAEAREKAARGEWAGVSQTGTFGEFVKRFDDLTANEGDYRRLVDLLGSTDSGERMLAAKIILSGPERTIPFLVEGLNSPYLAVRVGAYDILSKVMGDMGEYDPWSSSGVREVHAAAIEARLSEQSDPLRMSSFPTQLEDLRSVNESIDNVMSDDPFVRTRAMTVLVESGVGALPSIRSAIKGAEVKGDHSLVNMLEDIRWAILVHPLLAEEMPDIKYLLARGSSRQRQEIARKLSSMGMVGSLVLSELVLDTDPLVKESAAHALARINTDESLSSLASLLEVDNANLRMVAAQLLGETKNSKVERYLIQALNDKDEVVVVTAISALGELKAEGAGQGLIKCLDDSRWRVRATAAEVIGELKIYNAEESLKRLLKDTDPFVIKSAFMALSEMDISEEQGEYTDVMVRHPDLIPVVVEQLLENDHAESIQGFNDLYDRLEQPSKEVFLDVLSNVEYSRKESIDVWKGLFEKVLSFHDRRIRQKGFKALLNRPPEVLAEFVGRGMEDPDPEIRQYAVESVLWLIPYHHGYDIRYPGLDHGVIAVYEKTNESEDGAPAFSDDKMARAEELLSYYEDWHKQLIKESVTHMDVARGIALYLTGTDFRDLNILEEIMTAEGVKEFAVKEYGLSGLSLVLSRLPWPESQSLLDRLIDDPFVYAVLTAGCEGLSPDIASYLSRQELLVEKIFQMGSQISEDMVRALIEPSKSSPVSLLLPDDTSKRISDRLLSSDIPVLRCIGLAARSRDVRLDIRDFSRYLKDPDPWVRRCAVILFRRHISEQEELEAFLSPMLIDESVDVSDTAMAALLTPEIRNAAGLEGLLASFKYEDIETHVFIDWRDYYSSGLLPPTNLKEKLELLEKIMNIYNAGRTSKSEDTDSLALLLTAQYGDFRILNSELEARTRQDDSISEVLLIAIGLSRDVSYLPFIKDEMRSFEHRIDYTRLLEAISRMHGQGVRTLRREINLKIREMDYFD